MKSVQALVEWLILTSRWLLVVFFLGLVAALALYALAFLNKFRLLALEIFSLSPTDTILAMLGLIDAALVASLLLMVLVSGYANFVGRIGDQDEELSWIGKLDSGTLKVKLAASIVAISSIHLLQVFLNIGQYPNDKIAWLTLIHLTFLASAFLLAGLDRMIVSGKQG